MDIKDLVETVLKEYPSSRDNDLDLLARVWYKQGFKMQPVHFDFFLNHCTTPETITRIRREFQSKGQYKPEPIVAMQRAFKEEAYRVKYRKEPGNDLGDWGEVEANLS